MGSQPQNPENFHPCRDHVSVHIYRSSWNLEIICKILTEDAQNSNSILTD